MACVVETRYRRVPFGHALSDPCLKGQLIECYSRYLKGQFIECDSRCLKGQLIDSNPRTTFYLPDIALRLSVCLSVCVSLSVL